MTKPFKNLETGDIIYYIDRFSPFQILEEKHICNFREGRNGTLILEFDINNSWDTLPVFKHELETDIIITQCQIITTSLDALKQAMFKDVAKYNEEYKRRKRRIYQVSI